MVKIETIGMWDSAKNNPVLKSDTDVANYSFLTIDDDLYLILNTEPEFKETIPAGENLNGHLVKAWEGQKLVIDGKHITGGVSALGVGDALVVAADGTLETGAADGVHFVVTEKVSLTEPAVKVKVVVA